MDMCAVRESAFAGGMPDPLTCVHIGIWLDAVTCFDVHVEHVPAGLFIAVVVQILNDRAILGAHDPAIGDGDDPRSAGDTAKRFTGWGKIQCSPAGARVPTAMRTTGVRPGCPRLDG